MLFGLGESKGYGDDRFRDDVRRIREVAEQADIIMMTVPDQVAKEVYDKHIADVLKPGNMVMWAHGFNVHFDQVQAPDDVDVTMVAPKGPGHLVRRVYTEGGGVPALFAVHQNATESARQITLAYAKGIGATRSGVLETTFQTATGTVLLVDALAVGRNERGHDLGAGSPGVLLRSLACTDGEMDIEVSYAPRPEYGLIHPILEAVPGALAARGGADRLLLSGPAGFRIDGASATARLHVQVE